MAHRDSWRSAATCPKLGEQRKWLARIAAATLEFELIAIGIQVGIISFEPRIAGHATAWGVRKSKSGSNKRITTSTCATLSMRRSPSCLLAITDRLAVLVADDKRSLALVDRPGPRKAPRRHRDRLPKVLQSSSASRVTAGAAGFLTLIQCSDRPARYDEPSRFETMPSQPSLQA